jgi:sugar phosphate permease
MRSKWFVLALLWIAFFTAYLDRVNITIAGPTLMKAFALTPQQFGFVLAAFTAGYALLQVPGGMLADRYGTKRMLVIALLIWSLFTGLTGLAASFTLLLVVRFLFGIGEGLENGAHFRGLGDWFSSKERSGASGIFHTALALGPAIAAPIAAHILDVAGSKALFLLFTIPGVVVAIVVAAFFPSGHAPEAERRSEATPPASGGWQDVLKKDPRVWCAFVTYLCFNVAFWGFLGWMPSYLNQTRHIDLKALGNVASIPYYAGFVGLLVLGLLGRSIFYRFRPALIGASYLLAGLGFFVAFRADDVATSIAGLAGAAFFLYGGFGPFWAVVLDFIPEPFRAAFAGFVNFGGQIGGFFAPIVVGAIVTATKSYSGGFVFMIGALVVAAASAFALQQMQVRERRPLGTAATGA